MSEIDFERIRKEALEETTQEVEQSPVGDLIRTYADISSKVTKRMLEKYHQQLHKDA